MMTRPPTRVARPDLSNLMSLIDLVPVRKHGAQAERVGVADDIGGCRVDVVGEGKLKEHFHQDRTRVGPGELLDEAVDGRRDVDEVSHGSYFLVEKPELGCGFGADGCD